MQKIYLIPGMGADSRVYKHIKLPGYELIALNWIEPVKTDTLASYAQRLIAHYHIEPGSVLIGNSLGGMVAVEIAKLMAVDKVIQISSIKIISEAPAYYQFFRAVPVYWLIPKSWFPRMSFFIKLVFGNMGKEDALMFADMLRQTSPVFLKWSMYASLHWFNTVRPERVYQITGDKDMVFNYKRLPDATIVKGGTHIMVFERAAEINQLILAILKN